MNERRTSKILSLAVGIAGITVIIGWIFDIAVLKSVSPNWVSMKFDTAVAFLVSGITLYFIAKSAEGAFDIAQVVLSVTTLIILLLMGVLFFSAVFGIHTGAENLFVKEPPGTVRTVAPGIPSLPTMLNFILMAVAGILTMINPAGLQSKLKVIGLVIALIGATAVTGYIVNAPLLYYFIEGINSAMACHTAILFILLGLGLLCL